MTPLTSKPFALIKQEVMYAVITLEYILCRAKVILLSNQITRQYLVGTIGNGFLLNFLDK